MIVSSLEPTVTFTQDWADLGLFWVSQPFSRSDAQQGHPLCLCSFMAQVNTDTGGSCIHWCLYISAVALVAFLVHPSGVGGPGPPFM